MFDDSIRPTNIKTCVSKRKGRAVVLNAVHFRISVSENGGRLCAQCRQHTRVGIMLLNEIVRLDSLLITKAHIKHSKIRTGPDYFREGSPLSFAIIARDFVSKGHGSFLLNATSQMNWRQVNCETFCINMAARAVGCAAAALPESPAPTSIGPSNVFRSFRIATLGSPRVQNHTRQNTRRSGPVR